MWLLFDIPLLKNSMGVEVFFLRRMSGEWWKFRKGVRNRDKGSMGRKGSGQMFVKPKEAERGGGKTLKKS